MELPPGGPDNQTAEKKEEFGRSDSDLAHLFRDVRKRNKDLFNILELF